MGNLSDIDLNNVAEQGTFSALPAGRYTALATESEIKVTKAGTGKYLQFTLEILDGNYKGRKLWTRLNLWNPNETAVNIAKRELKAFSKAVGLENVSDSSDLLNKPLTLDVGIEVDDRKRETNVVKGYDQVGGVVSKAVNAVKDALSPASSTPPWMR